MAEQGVSASERGERVGVRQRLAQAWRWMTAQERWRERASRSSFINDVFWRPSVGVFLAWIIGVLLTLVGYLAVVYAPLAAKAAKLGHGALNEQTISPQTGVVTIIIVALAAIFIGWEDVARRRLAPLRWWRDFTGARIWRHWLLFPFRLLIRLPSILLSLADYILARIAATIIGATWGWWVWRYGMLSLWMGACVSAAWLLTPDRAAALGMPASSGLWASILGSVLVLGVVRRWSWIEGDREAFLTARREVPENTRIGFTEDLRDEALTALVFLFLLIPLGMRQVDIVYDVFEPAGAPDVLTWVGFFGAELTKSVPFVDWSEVFHVANGSPIEPKSTDAFPALGAQMVFGLRATLDLLLLAAVLQALTIAGRRREAEQAWDAGYLPLRDPFDERLAFEEAIAERVDWLGWRELDQPWVHNFPTYQLERLQEIVEGPKQGAGRRPAQVFRSEEAQLAALTLWAKQSGAEGVGELLTAAKRSESSALRFQALDLATDLAPRAAAEALIDALDSPEAAIRWFAASRLGWMRETRAAEKLRRLQAETNGGDIASVALAKMDDRAALEPLRAVLKSAPTATTALRARFGLHLLGEGDAPQLPETKELAGGALLMGGNRRDDEQPVHEVAIRAFSVAVRQTSFAEFDLFCEATGHSQPSDEGWGRDGRPVINVNWYDAQAYVAWLSKITGERWRLPTEAEWEFACRAGSETEYCFGDEPADLDGHAWYRSNSGARTQPVGSKKANRFGLYDMHGNVWEWCQDARNETYDGAPVDGSAWMRGEASRAVLRGGAWVSPADNLRSALRIGSRRSARDTAFGFRVARSLLE